MHREDNSKYLLYLEFKKELKSPVPIDDELVKILTLAIGEAKKGTSRYSDPQDQGTFVDGNAFRGSHRTDCGMMSSNCDYQLSNGMITNSLAPYYLMWYREHIPESELDKLAELERHYGKSVQYKAKNMW